MFVFGTECKIIEPQNSSRQSPTETEQQKTKAQQDCKLHDCRNTMEMVQWRWYNEDEDLEPERTIRQKKQGDINCMEERGERMGCMRNYRSLRPQPKPHETATPQDRRQTRLCIHIMKKHKGAVPRRCRTQKQRTQTADQEKRRNRALRPQTRRNAETERSDRRLGETLKQSTQTVEKEKCSKNARR